MSGVLYLSYTGVLEPLGQSQVLAYLERLAGSRQIHLVSFETAENWAKPDQQAAIRVRMQTAGIVWHPLRYHKWPSAAATAFDIAQGIVVGTYLARRHKLSIIHARSYVPSVMALAIKGATGARYLFDMRGFWADERVDGGIWARESLMFRMAKNLERRFLLSADAVVSLTHAARDEIARFPYLGGRVPPITVIPTCADLERFTPKGRIAARPFTLGYVGTIGNWYDFKATARLFTISRGERPDARFLVINRGEHEKIASILAAEGVDKGIVDVVAADHRDVPNLIRQMDAAILIARPAYSHIARAPTKLAEFLGCGVPCLINSGIGDMEHILMDNRVGVVVDDDQERGGIEAIRGLLALIAESDLVDRCAAVAGQHFSLTEGAKAYESIYEMLAPMRRSQQAAGKKP